MARLSSRAFFLAVASTTEEKREVDTQAGNEEKPPEQSNLARGQFGECSHSRKDDHERNRRGETGDEDQISTSGRIHEQRMNQQIAWISPTRAAIDVAMNEGQGFLFFA